MFLVLEKTLYPTNDPDDHPGEEDGQGVRRNKANAHRQFISQNRGDSGAAQQHKKLHTQAENQRQEGVFPDFFLVKNPEKNQEFTKYTCNSDKIIV